MGHDIFLSYSHENRQFAEKLESLLKPWSVFRDQASDEDKRLSGLDDWNEGLSREMREAKLVVLLVSTACAGRVVPTAEEVEAGVTAEGEPVMNGSSVAAEFRYFARELEQPWVFVVIEPMTEVRAIAGTGSRELLVDAVSARHALTSREPFDDDDSLALRASQLIGGVIAELSGVGSRVESLLAVPGDAATIRSLIDDGPRIIPAVNQFLVSALGRTMLSQGFVSILDILNSPGVLDGCRGADANALSSNLVRFVEDWALGDVNARLAVGALVRLGTIPSRLQVDEALRDWQALLVDTSDAAMRWKDKDADGERTNALGRLLYAWAASSVGSPERKRVWAQLIAGLEDKRVAGKQIHDTAYSRWVGQFACQFSEPDELSELETFLEANPKLPTRIRSNLKVGIDGAHRLSRGRGSFSEPATYYFTAEPGARTARICGFEFTDADLNRALRMLEAGLVKADPEKWVWHTAPQSLSDLDVRRPGVPGGLKYALRWQGVGEPWLLEPKQVIRFVHYVMAGYAPTWDFAGGKGANAPFRALFDEDPIVTL